MIRCQIEVIDSELDKKTVESRNVGIATRRLDFDTLLRRDSSRWMAVGSAAELSCCAERAQRELVAGDFQRFVGWMAVTHGHAMVRAAGLPLTRPHLALASA